MGMRNGGATWGELAAGVDGLCLCADMHIDTCIGHVCKACVQTCVPDECAQACLGGLQQRLVLAHNLVDLNGAPFLLGDNRLRPREL